MQACVLRETGDVTDQRLDVCEVDMPRITESQVLIRVNACGVCRTDLHVIEGELDLQRQKMPLIPGHQVVGRIEERGSNVTGFEPGDRVGVAWLHRTCGSCRYCQAGHENLCDHADFTGWTVDGGYAEYLAADPQFVYRLPEQMTDVEVAPLLCAGIIGYRCLRCCNIENWKDAKLGINGFGAAGHLAIQIARARGAEVYVSTRDERHQQLARELGAVWVGGAFDQAPVKLDAVIIFAPAGELVPAVLQSLDRGGTLVLGGIHMSPIPELNYQDLYWERTIRSVANNSRADGEAFLQEAARVGVRTSTMTFPLAQANDALIKLKTDAIRGAAVLEINPQ